MAAGQSISAISVTPSVMLVPRWMNRPVKSLRCRNDSWLTSSSAVASRVVEALGLGA